MTDPHPLVELLLLEVGATTGQAPSNEAVPRCIEHDQRRISQLIVHDFKARSAR